MSGPRFTPGPWVVTATPGGWDGVKEERGGGSLICSLSLNCPPNASLIAAAPDLAAFAAKVLATIAPCRTERGDDYLNEGGHAAIEALADEAEALLAKARGETP